MYVSIQEIYSIVTQQLDVHSWDCNLSLPNKIFETATAFKRS